MIRTTGRVMLSADDFGLTDGVSDAIAELAHQRRLSGTSALVTTEAWPRAAKLVSGMRQSVAVGLHLNLTLGHPLGPMPIHADSGELPPISWWIGWSCRNAIRRDEVAREIDRQIDRFEASTGASPDFIDGHHHVHVLPGVRDALAAVVNRRFRTSPILIRNPWDRIDHIVKRRGSIAKAAFVATLALGFDGVMHKAGAVTNSGFSGFSSFNRKVPFADELARFFVATGTFHVTMCHPGFNDRKLAALDVVTERREEEFRAIRNSPGLPDQILHPTASRSPADRIDWKSI